MFTLTLNVGMVATTETFESRAAAENRAREWMEEQRSTVDQEVESGNFEAAEIPFFFTVS